MTENDYFDRCKKRIEECDSLERVCGPVDSVYTVDGDLEITRFRLFGEINYTVKFKEVDITKYVEDAKELYLTCVRKRWTEEEIENDKKAQEVLKEL